MIVMTTPTDDKNGDDVEEAKEAEEKDWDYNEHNADDRGDEDNDSNITVKMIITTPHKLYTQLLMFETKLQWHIYCLYLWSAQGQW